MRERGGTSLGRHVDPGGTRFLSIPGLCSGWCRRSCWFVESGGALPVAYACHMHRHDSFSSNVGGPRQPPMTQCGRRPDLVEPHRAVQVIADLSQEAFHELSVAEKSLFGRLGRHAHRVQRSQLPGHRRAGAGVPGRHTTLANSNVSMPGILRYPHLVLKRTFRSPTTISMPGSTRSRSIPSSGATSRFPCSMRATVR